MILYIPPISSLIISSTIHYGYASPFSRFRFDQDFPDFDSRRLLFYSSWFLNAILGVQRCQKLWWQKYLLIDGERLNGELVLVMKNCREQTPNSE